MDTGAHTLRWDGRAESGTEASAGVYWIRVATVDDRKTVKLVVVR
jgi:flagellar hook assembly protein FlgD